MKVCSVCKRCTVDAALTCVEADHALPLEARKGHPRMVPGYTLEQLIGAGTNAAAYRARRDDCGQSCLIQIVSADPPGGEAFLRDAELAASIFDTGFVYVYESGQLGGGEYFAVTEDADAETLRDHLEAAGTPDLLTSIRIVEQTAEVLHVIHLKGLAHGAVRPENILVSFDDKGIPYVRVRNIDLGGAVARNTVSNKFLIDNAIELIRYFAPEQCSGAAASPRSDVYSLGVVFHELLAGAPPFDAPKAVALMGMHMNMRPPEITVEDFELRMLVTHSLSEALQKQPNFRQTSANAFARQMRHMEQLATHVSTPPPAVESSYPQRNSEISRRPDGAGAASTEPAAAEPPVSPSPLGTSRPTAGWKTMPSAVESEAPLSPAAEDSATGAEPVPLEEPRTTPVEEPTTLVVPEVQHVVYTHPGREGRSTERSALPEHRYRLRTLKKLNRSGTVVSPEIQGEDSEPEYSVDATLAHPIENPNRSTDEAIVFDTALPEQPPIAPKLIQWELPDDDIPSLEDVHSILVDDESNRTPADEVMERPFPGFQFAVPRPIEREPLADDVPPLAAMFEAWTEMRRASSSEHLESSIEPNEARVTDVNVRADHGGAPSMYGNLVAPTAESISCEPVVAINPHEAVTMSTPRDGTQPYTDETAIPRIATKNQAVSSHKFEVGFAPTILGENDRAPSTRPSRPISIFAGQEDTAKVLSDPSRRTALIVSGSAALIVMLLAGFTLLRAISTGSDRGDAVSSAPPAARVPARPAAVPPMTGGADTVEREPVKLLQGGTSTTDEAVPARRKSPPSRTETNPAERIEDEPSSPEVKRSPERSIPSKTNAFDKRDDRGRTQSQPNAVAEKPAPSQNNPTGATRPRIVAVPRTEN